VYVIRAKDQGQPQLAYRDPQELTCPTCKRKAGIVWVVGVGPNTQPGEGPSYVDILEDGGWLVETHGTTPRWRGRVTCPVCASLVWEKP